MEACNMQWIQVLALFLANAGLIFWFRTESRNDHRECIDLIIAIKDEMKDFHGKLERQDAEFKAHLIYSSREMKKAE